MRRATAIAFLVVTVACGAGVDPPRIEANTSMNIPQMIVAAAQRNGVDPQLAVEVAVQESKLNPNAVSSAGAIGVMQLMPATAAKLGVNPNVVSENIEGGVRYLGQQLRRFGDVAQALGAYNWGPHRVAPAVAEYGADWLSHAPAETRNYVAKILGNLRTAWAVEATPGSVAAGAMQKAGVADAPPALLVAGFLLLLWIAWRRA